MTLDTPIVSEVDIQEVDCFTKTATIFFDTNDPFHIDIEFSVTNVTENDKEDQNFYGKFDFDLTIELAHLIYMDDAERDEPFVKLEDYVTDEQWDKIYDRIKDDVQEYMTERRK